MTDSDPGFFIQFGVKVQDLFAGFAGGAVYSVALKKTEPVAILSSIVVGGFTANYLGEVFSHYLGIGQLTAGYVLGVTGMAITQGLVIAAKSWTPFGAPNKGTGNDVK